MSTDLYLLADSVSDEQSFLAFLDALSKDWYEEQEIEKSAPSPSYTRGALGWENGSIGAMLDASYHWGTASSKGLETYEKPSNPWCRVAHILLAGKFYE